MVAVKREVEEVQMAFNLDALTEEPLTLAQCTNDDPHVVAKKNQEVVDLVHEQMGTKILSQFICITKSNEQAYLTEYAKAKEKLYQSQFRSSMAIS